MPINVSTNIGKKFFDIIDTVFNKKHILHRIFNRNTIKLSYSCMRNISQIVKGHNKTILSRENSVNETYGCNCRNRNECPLTGKCLTPSLIYQATVTTKDNTKPEQSYVGLTANKFKERYYNHKCSFNNPSKRQATELSKYIWSLKDNDISHSINWRILTRARPYHRSANKCELCLAEKYFIIFKPEMASLIRRSELISTCRHSSKFLLRNSIT